jgi:hypothetical protein
MDTAPTPRLFRSVATEICSFAPLGMTALYMLLAVYSRMWAGHWPRYHEYLEVFASPAFPFIGAIFLFSTAASLLLAPLLWGALTWRARPGFRTVTRQIAVFVAGWLIFILLVIANPYGFTSFLID